MGRIFQYSVLLALGLMTAMVYDLSEIRPALSVATLVGLSYIMMEVGLEFHLKKHQLKYYGKDFLIALVSAIIPWVLCGLYFVFAIDLDFKSAAIVARFAAPTSAGILLTMLAAVGLGTTWLFQKARILAIFEELDTIVLMIPLQVILVGMHWHLFATIGAIAAQLIIAYIFLHQLRLPASSPWLLGYSVILVFICTTIQELTLVQIEVLLPAFVFGALMHNPRKGRHEHQFIEPHKPWQRALDRIIKSAFMFFVGASLPRFQVGRDGIWISAVHVGAIIVLMNVGKMFPLFCYKNEVPLRERLALCLAMFPRAEVGIGVLLVAIGYGISTGVIGLAAASLGLNLLLTGFYIWLVTKLIDPRTYGRSKGK